MNLMTSEERDDVARRLGYAQTADAPGVLRALNAMRQADRHHTDRAAVSQAIAGALTVIKRLLHIEAEYATTRTTVARLIVANNRGDDYSLSDLAFELERAQVDLKDDYTHADALAYAAEQEGLL
jgi:hypothetical protein